MGQIASQLFENFEENADPVTLPIYVFSRAERALYAHLFADPHKRSDRLASRPADKRLQPGETRC